MATYSAVLKSKPSDVGAMAVASNNLAAARKERELFDSHKRFNRLSTPEVQAKMTSRQRRAVLHNTALLHLYMNKGAECREAVAAIEKACPDSVLPRINSIETSANRGLARHLSRFDRRCQIVS